MPICNSGEEWTDPMRASKRRVISGSGWISKGTRNEALEEVSQKLRNCVALQAARGGPKVGAWHFSHTAMPISLWV